MQAQDVANPKSGLSFVAKTATPSEWKEIASCISAMVEDATFEISPDGISFRAMDSSHVALIDVLWPSSSFEKFECAKEDKFTVRMEDFAKLIKRSESRDSVEISRSGNESIVLKVGSEFYRREFELHLLETSAKPSPLPRLTFDAKIVMSYSAFAQALNDISPMSNHITIRASKDSVSFSGKGDVGKALAIFQELFCKNDRHELKKSFWAYPCPAFKEPLKMVCTQPGVSCNLFQSRLLTEIIFDEEDCALNPFIIILQSFHWHLLLA